MPLAPPFAQAVIGTPSGVEGYSLTSRSIGAVVPHEATTASLSNTGYANRGSSALLTFTVDLSTTPLPIEPEVRYAALPGANDGGGDDDCCATAAVVIAVLTVYFTTNASTNSPI